MLREMVLAVAVLGWGCDSELNAERHDVATRLAHQSGASSDGVDGEPGTPEPPAEQSETASAPRQPAADEVWLQISEIYRDYEVERYGDLPRDGFERFVDTVAKHAAAAEALPQALTSGDAASHEAYEAAVLAANLQPGPERQALKDDFVPAQVTSTVEIVLPESGVTP